MIGILGLACGFGLLRGLTPAESADSGRVITGDTFAEIAEKTLPSVVAVYVKSDLSDRMSQLQERFRPSPGDPLDNPELREFFRRFQGEREEQREDPHEGMLETRTSGSGVIISEEGHIVTNLHIIEGAREGMISIVLNDDREITSDKVHLLAVDEFVDLAVLKIDAEGLDLKPIAWGDSDAMRIGDFVVAIGNPLDLRGSVSKGIVSAKARKIYKADIERLIQTDAMINPGNSGGALVNLKGELIGVNMAIATNSGFFQGIGFAIPSKDVRFVTDQIIRDGRVRRGYIGIEMWPLDQGIIETLGLDDSRAHGIVVTDVIDGGPADLAGIEPYDVITQVDNHKIEETRDLLGAIATKAVGDAAELTVLRATGDQALELKLTMQVIERPTDDELNRQRRGGAAMAPRQPAPVKTIQDLGLVVAPFQSESIQGVEIREIRPQSPAAAARPGFSVGDIILEINRQEVIDEMTYRRALEANDEGRAHLFRCLQAGRRTLVVVEPGKD